MTDIFSECTERHLDESRRRVDDLKTLSSLLLANSARPSINSLKKLVQFYEHRHEFKNCCLQAVTSAANPFIPGMTLSICLAEAAKEVSDEERRTIEDIRTSVDDLLLEVFERLPRTVRGFDHFFPKRNEVGQNMDVGSGLEACAYIFEPESKGSESEDNDFKKRGPANNYF